MERVIPWIAVIAAVSIAIVAFFELDMRSDEDELAMEPTALPSPTILATETPAAAATTPPAATELATPQATPAEEPSPTPTIEPTPMPPTFSPGPTPESPVEPMPVTGGGALPAGMALTALAAALGVAGRRAY